MGTCCSSRTDLTGSEKNKTKGGRTADGVRFNPMDQVRNTVTQVCKDGKFFSFNKSPLTLVSLFPLQSIKSCSSSIFQWQVSKCSSRISRSFWPWLNNRQEKSSCQSACHTARSSPKNSLSSSWEPQKTLHHSLLKDGLHRTFPNWPKSLSLRKSKLTQKWNLRHFKTT